MNLKLLKHKRKLLGLTQEEFAEKIGIARTNYLKKENGKEGFKQEQIDKIIKELKLTPKEVVEIFFNK
ncbi:helix-turn-helix domain-containing protein [Gemella morbillorum]